MIKIILDAMGSDDRPTPEVEAAVIASNKFNVEIILVGNEIELIDSLSKIDGDKSKITIMHTPDAVDMSDHIKEARAKENNSMKVGMDIVASGNADAFVTAGNTGMAMYFAIKTFGLIKGLLRPCLCTVFPVRNGQCIVLDIGANAECRPDFLVQFAKMGSIYSQKIIGCKAPRIGLISNGEEEGKGNDLVRETFPLFKESIPGFIGNVEGKELFSGKIDVAVTDGFTGNVLLKSTEAVSKLIVEVLKENLMASLQTKIGALLAKPAFNALKKMLDPNEIGAAPLLGINGLVFVGHGRSNTKAMVSSILKAKQSIEANLLDSLRETIPNQVQ